MAAGRRASAARRPARGRLGQPEHPRQRQPRGLRTGWPGGLEYRPWSFSCTFNKVRKQARPRRGRASSDFWSGDAVRDLHRGRRHHRSHYRPDARPSTSGSRRWSPSPQGRGGRPGRVRHRRAPQPAVRALLAHDDARLHRRADRAAHPVHGDHADHHQRPGEDRRGLRDAAAPGRRPGGPDARPRQHRPGLPVVRQGHPPGHRAGHRELPPAAPAVARGRRRLGGQVPHARCRASPPPRARWTACRRSSGTARSAARRSPSRPRTTATGSSPTTSSGPRSTSSG